jgi:hypothetical protein
MNRYPARPPRHNQHHLLTTFDHEVQAVRTVVRAATPEKLIRSGMVSSFAAARQTLDGLQGALQTMERLQAGLSMIAARGAKPVDVEFHRGSVEVAETLWGDR